MISFASHRDPKQILGVPAAIMLSLSGIAVVSALATKGRPAPAMRDDKFRVLLVSVTVSNDGRVLVDENGTLFAKGVELDGLPKVRTYLCPRSA